MAKVTELDIEFDHNKFHAVYEILGIDDEIRDRKIKQMALHSRLGSSDPYYESVGSLGRDFTKFDPSKMEGIPEFDAPNEDDFNIINEMFQGTYIEYIIKEIEKQYKIYRGRFMMMKSKTSLTLHNDNTQRIHIPVYTNPKCFMTIEDEVIRLPEGKIYLVDTTVEHTAVNASIFDRTHLVLCTDIK